MIGLSPLSPGHRRTFQRTSVRPSTGSYPRFSLPRDSSPGFASAARDWNRPFRTRFRSGSLPSLTSPRASNSLAHSTKGTPSQDKPAPTPCGRTVSGTVSLPSRGAFHLSLTVLLLYRSSGSILAWRVVPPASHGIPRAPRYSGSGYVHFIFDYVALTLFDWPSQTIRLTKLTDIAVHNPAHIATYGLASSDFARHYFRNLG